MATGSILLSPGAGTPPDGSTNNAAPAMSRRQGTNSDPKRHYLTLDFDASTDEHIWFTFEMPANYASGGSVTIKWQANATSGTCRWGASVGAVTAGDADTLLEHAQATAVTGGTATNATEARRVNETTLDLSSNMDSAAAGDTISLLIWRDANGGSGTDDLSVDAEFISAVFEYTTS